MAEDTVLLENVVIGVDSPSGLAVSVEIEGEWHWLPYSQITEVHRHPTAHNSDSIRISRWLAEKKELV